MAACFSRRGGGGAPPRTARRLGGVTRLRRRGASETEAERERERARALQVQVEQPVCSAIVEPQYSNGTLRTLSLAPHTTNKIREPFLVASFRSMIPIPRGTTAAVSTARNTIDAPYRSAASIASFEPAAIPRDRRGTSKRFHRFEPRFEPRFDERSRGPGISLIDGHFPS